MEVLHQAGTCLENNGIRREGEGGRYARQQTETCLLTAERGSTALTRRRDLLSTLLSCFSSPRLLCPLLLHFDIFSTNRISFPSSIFSLTPPPPVRCSPLSFYTPCYHMQLHKSIQIHVAWYRKASRLSLAFLWPLFEEFACSC